MALSVNFVTDLQELFRYPFMQHALEAGTIVAVIAGIVGYFVVLRRSSFAAHALSLRIVSMLLVAVSSSVPVQVVGVLLIFSLMVTPAAIAQQLAKRARTAIMISVTIALVATWLGLSIAYYGPPYPVSFYITTLVFSFYLLVRFVYRRVRPLTAYLAASQET